MTVHYCFDSRRIYVLTAKMVSLMTEDDNGKSTHKRGSCHSSTDLGQEVILYNANFYPVLLALMTREFSFQLQSCFKRLFYK